MTKPNRIDRRTFVQQAAALSSVTACYSTQAAVLGSNERVRLGVIGVGNRGDNCWMRSCRTRTHKLLLCVMYMNPI